VLGLLVYALLGFVVPAWIFKRLGRREWSFAVMVAAAIAAAFAIYRLGVFSSIGGAEVDEVSIVRMAPGSAVVRAASYLGLISPGFDTIGIAAPGALPHPLRSERREPWRRGEHMTVPRTDVQVVKGRELRLAPIRLFPNAMHLVRLDHEARADEVLLVERVPRDDGKNDIRLVNRGKSHLEFFLVERGRRALSRPLEPGEEAILPEWRSFRFEDLPVVDSYRYVAGGEGPEAQAAVSMALRAVALPQESEEPNYLAPQPIKRDGAAKRPWDGDAPRFLVALSRDPVFPAVDGVRKRKALSLYVVELSREDAP